MSTETQSPTPTPTPTPTPPAPSRSRLDWFTAALLFGVIALGALVLLLIAQNRRLIDKNIVLERALVEERTKDALAVGQSIAPLRLTAADGTTIAPSFTGPNWTLIFLLDSHCPYCEATLPVWTSVLTTTAQAHADGSPSRASTSQPSSTSQRPDILVIQSDATRPDQLRPLPAPLVPLCAESSAGTWLNRVPIAPAVLLIDTHAVVRKAWFGVPSDRDRDQLVQAVLNPSTLASGQ